MNSMQMPQQAPAQGAGLGAMIQAKGARGAGAPKQNMEQMMALAEKLPDSELADVLAGKSVRVPQFAAMLAAMSRDSLRTAVAGAQAGQAGQPSAKDKMLAKMSGLDALPAPNMEQLGEGMAAGGIVAFNGEDGSDVTSQDRRTPAEKAMDEYIQRIRDSATFRRDAEPAPSTPPIYETDPQARADREAIASFGRKSMDVLGSVAEAPLRGVGTISNYLINRPLRAAGVPIPEVPAQFRYGAPAPQATSSGETIGPQGTVPLREAVPTETAPKVDKAKPKADTAATNLPRPGGQAPGIAPPTASAAPSAPEARKSLLDDIGTEKDDVAKRIAEGKNQAQGEFFMQLGASLLSTPNLGMALSKGVQAGLPGLAANRKEANTILKDQREYQLNLAKAKEAAAQGKDNLAFKYAKLAEDSKYHMGMVAAANMRASGANAFGPKQYQAAMKNAQTEVDALIAKMSPSEKRRNPPNRDQLIEAAFNRNLQAYQSGVMPSAPGIPMFDAPPQGAVTRE